MDRINAKCAQMESKLADLLLDPGSVPARVRDHVAACERCGRELAELQATMSLLDQWEGPEPSPYFMTRFNARLREERQAPPVGWFARIRAQWSNRAPMPVRPLAAMALTVVLFIGGGAWLGITDWDQSAPPQGQAAVVHDLQTLESNAQLLDQLEALSASNDNGE